MARAMKAKSKSKKVAAKAADSVQVWADDPKSGQAPIERRRPDLAHQKLLPLQMPAELPPGPPGSKGFRFWTAAEALRRAAEMWAGVLPAGTSWWLDRPLPVRLDAGVDLNAYYDRRSLSFFHAAVGGTTVYSGESPDVVCHELGHAVLDAIRPQLWDAMSDEVAAFHEAFGDISALLAAWQLTEVRTSLVDLGPKTYRASFVSRLAEQLGWAIRQSSPDAVDPDCLRNAVNSLFYRSPDTLSPSGPASTLSSEPHSFSRVFTGGFYEALGNMVATIDAKPSEQTLLSAATDAAALLVDAVIAAPVVADYYSQVAAHMIDADDSRFGGRYRDALTSAFVRRGILTVRGALGAQVASGQSRRHPERAMPAGRRPATRRAQWMSATAAQPTPFSELPTTPMVLPEFGLATTPILVRLADETRRFAVRGAARAGGEAPGQAGDSAARQFMSYLFRRGRVDFADRKAAALPTVRHDLTRKTHEIRSADGGFALTRRCFDCGFD